LKAQFSLTPSESKRLIAKAVKEHEDVKRALKKGIVAIALGSTNALVAEEILGERIEKERYIAGFIDERGACVVPASDRLGEIILKDGKVIEEKIGGIVEKMGNYDVFIKGANALDYDGIVGVMMASEVGGTIAQVLGILKARGVKLIIPIGLEKLIPNSISEASKFAGIYEMDYSDGIPVGLMPVSGEVITEIEAFKILTGADAFLIGSGGLGRAGGSKTFLVMGEEREIEKSIEIVKGVKGEKEVKGLRGSCKTCAYDQCPNKEKDL
jgi:hypothetical protein